MAYYTISVIELVGNQSFNTSFWAFCDTFEEFKESFINQWSEFNPYTPNSDEDHSRLSHLVSMAESESLLSELLFYTDFFVIFSKNGVPV